MNYERLQLRVTLKMLLGHNLSIFEATTLCQSLMAIPNSARATFGDAKYHAIIHIKNIVPGQPPSFDISPRSDWEAKWIPWDPLA